MTAAAARDDVGRDYAPIGHWTERLIVKPTRQGCTLTGTPKLPNAITILTHHPAWKGVLAFDEFSLRIVFTTAPPFHPDDAPSTPITPGTQVKEEDYTRIASWFARTELEIDTMSDSRSTLAVSPSTVAQAVAVVARSQSYHPVRAFLDRLTWDGTERLSRWVPHYLGAPDNAYTRAVGRWWLISAIARIYQPGCKADHVLTLEGPQGIGKSTALHTLGAPWFTDEIADLASKDALMQMHGVWIVEFAEFDTLSRAESARAKAFITARTDRFRLPYSSTVEEFPRSCVCAATVNGSAYLKDDTGNRRYWPIACAHEHPIALDELARDREQLIAEAVHAYRAGEAWWPTDPSLRGLLETEQRERLNDDDWEGPIAAWLRSQFDRSPCAYQAAINRPRDLFDAPLDVRKLPDPCGRCTACLAEWGVTTFDVLRGALELEIARIDRSAQTRAGSCLLRLGWEKARRTDRHGRRVWAYLPPPPPAGPPSLSNDDG